jgi:hypothetical protein
MYGTMGGMEKTTVYLTAEQKAALALAAQADGRSEARLIRDGVDAVLAGHRAAEVMPALGEDPSRFRGPAASLERPRWIGRDAFLALVVPHRADAGLRAELRDLSPDTTDDEPLS